MFRERSNLTLKRERSMLADMGQAPQAPSIDVTHVPDAGGEDGGFDAIMADAEGKYAQGDYEGALMVYSMALGLHPERTEILDGLTKAQSALEEKLANPDPVSSSNGQTRVSEGQASTPGAPSRNASWVATPVPAPRNAFASPVPPAASGAAVHGAESALSYYDARPPTKTSRMDDPRASSQAAFGQPIPASPFPASPAPAHTSAMGAASPYPREASAVSSFPSSASAMAAAPQYRRGSQASVASFTPATPAAVSAAAAAAVGGRSSRARPPSSRLNSRPPSAARAQPARPITPAATNEDPRLFAIMQMGKIEEDISQELWDRCIDRCERLIDALRKAPKDELDTEEKETYMGSVYNSLGKAHFAMGNMDKALEDHNLAIHIAETYDLFDVKANADEAIGRIHISLGRESSTVWEETIKIDKEVRPKSVAPPPVPGNLTRTKTILATEDSPAMVDIAMPATVKSWNEEANLEAMLEEAKAKTEAGDHEGALMLYSAAQTQYPNEPEVEYGLKAAEAALQKSMEGVMTSRAGDKKVRFDGGWTADQEVEDAAVYLDPEQEIPSLRQYADEQHEQIEQDLESGNLVDAQRACEEFLEKIGSLKDDVTHAERFAILATVHNQLGRALGAQGDTNRALEEHNAALQIADRNGLDDIKVEALDLSARLYLSQGEIETAISTWKECLPICLDQSEKSEIYHKMALAELSQDNYVQARINGDKAAMAAAKAKDELRQANARVIIGMTLVKTGDRVGAIEEYRKALTLATAADAADLQEDIKNRIDALESGDLEEAAAPSMDAVAGVLVVASPIPSRDASRNTSRNHSRVTSRNQSRVASPETSRRSSRVASRVTSRAASPERRMSQGYRLEDETDALSPRGVELGSLKSPRPLTGQPSSVIIEDTMTLLQMYLLFTLPEF